jgi:hypothetical protein
MAAQIVIRYWCKCVEDAHVKVEERQDGEQIGDWMKKVTLALVADHRTRGCEERSLAKVMIPTQPGEPIGKARTD